MKFIEFLATEENQEKLNKQIQLVAEKEPDFVYNTFGEKASCTYNGPCRYRGLGDTEYKTGPDTIGCLFGKAAQQLGVTDFGRLGYINQFLPDDSKFGDSWRKVQRAQDNGESWGNAIKLLE